MLYLAALGVGLGAFVDQSNPAGVEGVDYATFLAPGILVATAMNTATGESTYPVMAGIRWLKTYVAMILSPLDARQVATGQLLWVSVRLALGALARAIENSHGSVELKQEEGWGTQIAASFVRARPRVEPEPVAQILNILEDYPIGFLGHNTADTIHLMAEAIRIVAGLYKDGVIAKPESYAHPFPDLLTFHDAPTTIEHKLFQMHLKHRMRTFQGTFHSNPDYALWYGWSAMVRDLTSIKRMAADLLSAGQVNSLLAGILMMTILYSVNLRIMGRANIQLLDRPTVFTFMENMDLNQM